MSLSLLTPAQAKKANHSAIFIQGGNALFGADLALLDSPAQTAAQGLIKKEDKGPKTHAVLGEKHHTTLVFVRKVPGLDKQEELRLAAFELGKSLLTNQCYSATIFTQDIQPEEAACLCEGLEFAQYEFKVHKSTQAKSPTIKWGFLVEGKSKAKIKNVIESTTHVMGGVKLTRDLINEPGGTLHPQEFVKRIQSTFKGDSRFKIKVRNRAQLEKEGFHGLITVGRGSLNPPSMVTIHYTPQSVSKSAQATKLGLVGKGVTFDTGGISLKPPHPMWEMRMDMGGAGTVIGAMKAIADLDIKVPVVAIVCLTENRPGADAVLPGDIFTAKNGKTVMVENTDAEGRLILSDGLAEAGLNKATHIVNLATLTGAIIRAIGTSMTGLFCNNEELAETITRCGAQSGEKFWRLPLEEEYRSALDDKVADLRNIGGDAGAITAGLFLQEFVPENTPWAHLDIAGTAFTTKSWKYHGWGATGWGVRSLVNLAEDFAKK